MTITPTPADLAHRQDAEVMGRRAGWNHRMLRNDLDRPAQQWAALLREIAVDPWGPGQYDTTRYTPETAATLSRHWAHGWKIGDHQAQGQLRRATGQAAAA